MQGDGRAIKGLMGVFARRLTSYSVPVVTYREHLSRSLYLRAHQRQLKSDLDDAWSAAWNALPLTAGDVERSSMMVVNQSRVPGKTGKRLRGYVSTASLCRPVGHGD